MKCKGMQLNKWVGIEVRDCLFAAGWAGSEVVLNRSDFGVSTT